MTDAHDSSDLARTAGATGRGDSASPTTGGPRGAVEGPPLGPVESRRNVPTRIPDGETPAARCPYCGRPFRTERLRDLHVGEVHEDERTDAEGEAHDEADEAELDELFFYHIKVVVLIGLLFSAFVLGYTVVLSGGV